MSRLLIKGLSILFPSTIIGLSVIRIPDDKDHRYFSIDEENKNNYTEEKGKLIITKPSKTIISIPKVLMDEKKSHLNTVCSESLKIVNPGLYYDRFKDKQKEYNIKQKYYKI